MPKLIIEYWDELNARPVKVEIGLTNITQDAENILKDVIKIINNIGGRYYLSYEY